MAVAAGRDCASLTRTLLMNKALRAAVFVLFAALAPHAAAAVAEREPECGSVTGDPELAIKVCTRLIEFAGLDRPNLAQAYYARGSEWASQRNYDRAISDFNMALELDPKLAGAYYNRALAWSEKNEHDRAIADYDAALQLSPRETRAHIGRAVEFTAKGEYKRAIADYESAIRLKPEDMSGYFGRGRVRFYTGDFMSAASDFVRAHRLDPSIYTALWIFLARKRADIAGEKTLAQEAGTQGAGEWPAPLVGLYLGSTTPEAVQKAAVHLDATRQREQRCEANFFIAQWQLLRGAREPAAQLLRDASSACPSTFAEYEGAVVELRRLEEKR